MTRVKVPTVVEQHSSEFKKVLEATLKVVAPELEIDSSELIREFKKQVNKRFPNWVVVPAHAVDQKV